MATLTAIETTYAGHRFRSRLEARWAVFFDKLGVRWLYEPQGYTVPNGARYLPDFWLPDSGLWVEVKGSISRPQPGEHYTWHTLQAAAQVDGLPASLEVGVRWVDAVEDQASFVMLPPQPRLLILGEIPRLRGGGAWLHPCLYLICGRPFLQFARLRGAEQKLSLLGVGTPEDAACAPMEYIPSGLEASDLWQPSGVLDAYDTARQARFEHGESGALRSTLQEVVQQLERKAAA